MTASRRKASKRCKARWRSAREERAMPGGKPRLRLFSGTLGRTALTRVELRVGIAVGAMAAGLLRPARPRARAQAREVHCINQERQPTLGYRTALLDRPDDA